MSVKTIANNKKNSPFEISRSQPSTMKLTMKSATTMEIAINKRLFKYSARMNFTLAGYFHLIDNLTYNFISRYTFHFFVGCQHNTMAEHR